MCRLGASGLGPPGDGRVWPGMFALRAKPTIALPPSQHSGLSDVTTPPKAAVIEVWFSLGRTAAVVAPLRSRAKDGDLLGRQAAFGRLRRACVRHAEDRTVCP